MRTLCPIVVLLACLAAEKPRPDLRIDREGWGNADLGNVEAVLRSAATPLSRHFDGLELPAIQVSPKGGPIVLHKRAEDGSVIMRLGTGDRFWAQYAFQFSHELCHVLCRYDQDPNGQRWFEESLCELASLYTLREMSRTWETSPPYPNWKSFAPHLASYAQDRIDKAQLPAGMSLARWWRENAAELEKNPTDRDRNTVVAAALLPLFEREPAQWRAAWYLNAARHEKPLPFKQYLQDWHDQSPAEHRTFIRGIAAQFDVPVRGQ